MVMVAVDNLLNDARAASNACKFVFGKFTGAVEDGDEESTLSKGFKERNGTDDV